MQRYANRPLRPLYPETEAKVSDPSRDRTVPRGALIGAAVLIGLTMTLALTARLGEPGSAARDAEGVVAERALRFEDRSDGAITVYDARADEAIHVLGAGEDNFIRGTLRGLVRARKRSAIGPEIPFRLFGRTDGRVFLQDPATGRLVDLGAFGETNALAFAQFLPAAGTVR